jgi:sec-independent protein translocase protein TatA
MDVGGPEMLIILAVVVLLFGGAKIPQLARSIGQAKREFSEGLKDGEKGDPKPAAAPAPEAIAPAPPKVDSPTTADTSKTADTPSTDGVSAE